MGGRTSRPGRGGRPGRRPRPSGLARPKGRRRPPDPDGGAPRPDEQPTRFDYPPYDQAAYDQAPYDQAPYDQAPYDQAAYDQAPYDQRGDHAPGAHEPPGPPGPGMPHGRPGDDAPRPSARRPRSGPRGRLPHIPPIAFFIAAGAVVLIAVVTAVTMFVPGGGGGGQGGSAALPKVKNVRAEGPGASAYSQAASTSVFAPIATRAKDPKPLTAAEAFTPKKITDGDAKATLRLTASSLVSHCATAIWGEDLAGRLRLGGCTQVARTAYEDKNFDALVTVFNLVDDRAADQVVADADPKAANGFPLAPPKANRFDQGFSIARGVAMGHYAVITWVRHADGSGDESDPALLSLLVSAGKPNAVLVRAAGRDPRP
jgi:hypothetical protein